MFETFVNWLFATVYDVLQLTWPGTSVSFWQVYLGAIVLNGLMAILIGWALSRDAVDTDFAKPIRNNREGRYRGRYSGGRSGRAPEHYKGKYERN